VLCLLSPESALGMPRGLSALGLCALGLSALGGEFAGGDLERASEASEAFAGGKRPL
jgi:hypothetical protein